MPGLSAPARQLRWLVTCVVTMLAIASCGDDPIHDLAVKITGQHSLEVGKTLALSAETVHGTDSAYTPIAHTPGAVVTARSPRWTPTAS